MPRLFDLDGLSHIRLIWGGNRIARGRRLFPWQICEGCDFGLWCSRPLGTASPEHEHHAKDDEHAKASVRTVLGHHKKIEDMIGAMLDAYVAVAGRPASTKHIDEMIAKGTDKGVAWPAQLMVLMEDIRARSSTI